MREVVRGGSIAFVFKVLATGLGFCFNVLLARFVGAEGAGAYYLALVVTTLATVVGRVGLDNALLRFAAVHAAANDWSKVSGLYRKGMQIAAVVSALVALAVVGVADWLAESIFAEPRLTVALRLMALSIVPMSLLTLHGSLLRGLKRTRDALLVEGVGVPLIGTSILAFLGGSLGVIGPVSAYVAATFLVLLIALGLWRRATPQLRGLSGSFPIATLVRSSLPMFWVASANLAMGSVDTVMLGIWTNSHSVGIYGVALRTAALTSFVLGSVNAIAPAKFAALHAQGNHQALGALARNSAKLMTLAAAPLLLLFLLAPSWVLRLFGPEFTEGATVLMILAIGHFVNVATGSVGFLLLMTGHERLMRNNVLGTLVLNIILNLWLIPSYGIVGAAVATAVSLVVKNLVAAVLVQKKLAIKTIPFL